MTQASASVALTLASLAGLLPPAFAAPAPSGWRITNSLGASVNRLGAQNDVEASWTRGRIAVGFGHALSPAFTRAHGWLEVTPVRAATLRVGLAPSAYFGTFDGLMGFQSLDDDYGDDARRGRRPGAKPGTAVLLYAAPTLRMAAGPLVAVASASLERWHSSADAPVFYEPSRDALLDTRGGTLVSTSSMLLVRGKRADGGDLAAGFVHKLTHVPDASANDAQRVGVVAVRAFGGRRFGLRQPRLSANVVYALRDRFRQGELGAAAAVGFRVGR